MDRDASYLSARVTLITPRNNVKNHYLPDFDDREIWVLRDDELRGFWGTKARKYAAITRHCLANNIKHIIATGGINSNNLAAAAILCAEAGIELTAFAVEDHSDGNYAGNRMLIRLALPPERLVLVPRTEKPKIPALMQAVADKLKADGSPSLVLQEGGGCAEAVDGCLTLADEIMRPRSEWADQKPPSHVFIDSGTALSAASLAAGMLKKGLDKTTKLHIIQMAGFEEQVDAAFREWVTPVTGVTWADVSHFTRVYRPLSPRSYGATSEALFEFIRYMAREHGILSDPVYSGKLFMRAFDLIKGQNCRGRIVLIHTGGVTGLMGYSQITGD
jgi:1-aminocyclopropane-1-carboxylate deaminase